LCYQYGTIGPTAGIAYFTDNTMITNTSSAYDVSVTGAANFVGVRHHFLAELSPSGQQVKGPYYLGTFNWVSVNTTTNGNLALIVMQGTSTSVNLRMEIHFVVSSSLANLTSDGVDPGALLPPKGFEQYIAIDASKYVYQSTSNSLAMVSYVVTGQATVQANIKSVANANSANSAVSSGSGNSGVTYKTSTKAVSASGGSSTTSYGPVTVTITQTNDFTVINGANDIVKQVQAVYNAQATIYQVQAVFSPDASLIKYDPNSFSGSDPDQTGTGASSTTSGTLSLTVNLLFLLSLLFFFSFC